MAIILRTKRRMQTCSMEIRRPKQEAATFIIIS